MNVAEVPVRDWPLYFNGVYMKYDDRIVKVDPTTHAGRTVLMCTGDGGFAEFVWRKPDLRRLEVWWPRPGAYNYNGSAVYIARKATRCMRKSCCPRTHYYIKWGKVDNSTIRYLLNGPNHITWEAAKQTLDSKLAKSVAICRDLILTRVNDGYEVIYRGDPAGKLNEYLEYTADNDFSPTTKLVVMRLAQEGIV